MILIFIFLVINDITHPFLHLSSVIFFEEVCSHLLFTVFLLLYFGSICPRYKLFIGYVICWYFLQFMVTQMVKNPPAVQETRVRSLGREDPLEKGMATHSSVLAWGIPWTEEPGGVQSMGWQRVGCDWATNTRSPIYSLSFHSFVVVIVQWLSCVWLFATPCIAAH